MPDLTPEAFLERFWSFNETPDGSYHMTSTKGATWTDSGHPSGSPVDPLPYDNLFFTPTPFSEARRLAACATGKSPWLFADLDEVNPEYLDIKPQIAWETSPGRYQCAWRLKEPLGIRALERLNKAMTYHTKADKGGWSWTKALRVPGSTSLKRDNPVPVCLLWSDWSSTLDAARLRGIVKAALPEADPSVGPLRLPKATAAQIRKDHWAAFSPRLRKLLRQRALHPGDDRSARLWEVENLALAAGLTVGQVVRLASATPFNKYKGQRRELRALHTEVLKAQAHQKANGGDKPRGKEVSESVVHFTRPDGELTTKSWFAKADMDLLGHVEPPDYVIDGVLARGQVMILSADSGVGKSWVALDLCRAAILRSKWLGRSVVGRKVMYVDEENGTRILNGRLRGLILDGEHDVQRNRLLNRNLWMCSRNGVSIGDQEQQEELEKVIVALTPSLLIIDTAMSATEIQEVNDNSGVVALMKKLRYLAEKHHLAVVLMHHDRKPTGDQEPNPHGTNMMGARQWSGQADTHLAITPLGQDARRTKSGRRVLETDVILTCAKLRDDVPFNPEHIQIRSLKDSSGRIARATVKSVGPAPRPDQVHITPRTPNDPEEEVHDMRYVRPKYARRKTNTAQFGPDPARYKHLSKVLAQEGSVILEEIAADLEMTTGAVRSMIARHDEWNVEVRTVGKPPRRMVMKRA